jgi:CBS domain-containing protein
MLTVENIVVAKPEMYNIVSPGTTVFNALNMLNSVNLSYLVVMDGDHYKGIFCERNYSRKVILRGRASKDTFVSEVMTTDVPMVTLQTTVEECMKTMNTFKTRYLLAFDNETLKGVITIHDLLRQVIENKEQVFDSSLARLLELDDE